MAFFASLVAGGVLVAKAPSTREALPTFVYVLCLVTMYGVSALYHRPHWGTRGRAIMRRFDHAAIFLLIAGTYTPLCLLGLLRAEGVVLLTVVWVGAVAGIVQCLFFPRTPRWLSAAPYVALGWAAVASIPYVTPLMGWDGIALVAAGGVAYTVGATIYVVKRPDPVPRVFGYHEIFHALVIVASVLHFVAIARLVLVA